MNKHCLRDTERSFNNRRRNSETSLKDHQSTSLNQQNHLYYRGGHINLRLTLITTTLAHRATQVGKVSRRQYSSLHIGQYLMALIRLVKAMAFLEQDLLQCKIRKWLWLVKALISKGICVKASMDDIFNLKFLNMIKI